MWTIPQSLRYNPSKQQVYSCLYFFPWLMLVCCSWIQSFDPSDSVSLLPKLTPKPKICFPDALFYKLWLLTQSLQEQSKKKAMKRNLKEFFTCTGIHIHHYDVENKTRWNWTRYYILFYLHIIAWPTPSPTAQHLLSSFSPINTASIFLPFEACSVIHLARLFPPSPDSQCAYTTPLRQRRYSARPCQGVKSSSLEDFVNPPIGPIASLKYPKSTRIQPCQD